MAKAISELAVGEALVSMLLDKAQERVMADILIGKGENALHLMGKYGNRHGLIAAH